MISDVDQQTLGELEVSISSELEGMLPKALQKYARLTGRSASIHSMHATFGSKNNTYVDAVQTQFIDFRDFLAQWLHGLNADATKYGRLYPDSSAGRIVLLLGDKFLRKYAFQLLERNFYRNYYGRTRAKPSPSLWQVWFGNNSLVWGMVIAPVFNGVRWTNDRSEMRRATYDYWTIGHVLKEGLVDPAASTPYRFSDVSQLLRFYQSILKRVSNSIYEQAIAERYVNYIEESEDQLSEPFLIPELRYAGLEKKHIYRLDYTVLNPHTMSYVGFELSPNSTHFYVTGVAKKTQKSINAELAEAWEREMGKRNEYFAKYGVTTHTFTDTALKNMDACFAVMKETLSARPKEKFSVSSELARLEDLLRS